MMKLSPLSRILAIKGEKKMIWGLWDGIAKAYKAIANPRSREGNCSVEFDAYRKVFGSE